MELDIKQIKSILPHRYPMLLIDHVLEMMPGRSIIAIKNVSINEPFFDGHFPHIPIMPGVLIIESMAQAAALLSFSEKTTIPKMTAYYLVGVDDVRFRKPVSPGDQLRIEVDAKRLGRSVCKYKARALVNYKIVSEATLMCAIRNLENS